MAKSRFATIRFPTGGLNRRQGYQEQPPYTTPDCLNVRPEDPAEGRERGGSRPGLSVPFNVARTPSAAVTPSSMNYDSDTDRTTAVCPNNTFTQANDGMQITFATSGEVYDIASITSHTTAVIVGDCSAEAGTFTIASTGAMGLYGNRIVRAIADTTTFGEPAPATVSDSFQYAKQTFLRNVGMWGDLVTTIEALASRGGAYMQPPQASTATYALVAPFSPTVGEPYSITFRRRVNDAGSVSILACSSDLSVLTYIRFRFTKGTVAGTFQLQVITRVNPAAETVVSTATCTHPPNDGFKVSVSFSGADVTVSAGPIDDSQTWGTTTQTRATFPDDNVYLRMDGTGATLALCPLIQSFQVDYSVLGSVAPKRSSIVACGGKLYQSDGSVLVETASPTSSSSPKLASDRTISHVKRSDRIYFADHGIIRRENQKSAAYRVTFSTNNRLVFPTYQRSGVEVDLAQTTPADMALSDNRYHDAILVMPTSTEIAQARCLGVYSVASVVSASSYITVSPSHELASGTADYRITRCPKYFDPITGTMSRWLADEYESGDSQYETQKFKGVMPLGCPLIARYRDRIFLGGAASDPHVWYASRQADPHDWNVSDTDSGAAIAGTAAGLGEIADPLTAIIAHTDDYLVFSSEKSMWLLRGDPAAGGSLDPISQRIGVLMRNAFCMTPDATIVFLSNHGLYAIPSGSPTTAGGSAYPVLLSAAVPKELTAVSASQWNAAMAFDVVENGIHLFLTNQWGNGNHWWIDWSTKSFWPVGHHTDHSPVALGVSVDSSIENSLVLLGGRDGYVRRYDPNSITDDGEAIESYVLYGPIQLGTSGQSGFLHELNARMGGTSGDVAWSVFCASTPEEAVRLASASESAVGSGTWTSGANYSSRVRGYGSAAVIRVDGVTDRWSAESIDIMLAQAGILRLP